MNSKLNEKNDMSNERVAETAKQRHDWIGLTQEEKNDLSMEMVKAGKSVNWLTSRIEAKLKEKNT